MYINNYNLFFILCILTGSMSVKIINLNVPETYIINEDENSEKLILDCEYEIQPNETGFVLKWLFNGIIGYQWILHQKPFALVSIFT